MGYDYKIILGGAAVGAVVLGGAAWGGTKLTNNGAVMVIAGATLFSAAVSAGNYFPNNVKMVTSGAAIAGAITGAVMTILLTGTTVSKALHFVHKDLIFSKVVKC